MSDSDECATGRLSPRPTFGERITAIRQRSRSATLFVTWPLSVALLGFALSVTGPSPRLLDYIIMGSLFAAAASALQLVVGITGQLALGHHGLWGVSAYVSGIVALRWSSSPWLGLAAALVITAVLAAILGIVAFKLREFYFALITLAFGMFVQLAALGWRSLTGGASGLNAVPGLGGSTFVEPDYKLWLPLALGFVGFTIALCKTMRDGSHGLAWRAIARDEELAASSGIDVRAEKLIVFVVSGSIVAVVGFLYARYVQFIDPPSFSTHLMVTLLIIVSLSPPNSVVIPALMAFAVRLIYQLPSHLVDYRNIMLGSLLFAAFTVRDRDLISIVRRRTSSLKHRPGGLRDV